MGVAARTLAAALTWATAALKLLGMVRPMENSTPAGIDCDSRRPPPGGGGDGGGEGGGGEGGGALGGGGVGR